MRRAALGVWGLLVASLASGCIVKCNGRDGLCFKPLFRVRFELNRANGEFAGDRWNGRGGENCACADGGHFVGSQHGSPQFLGDGFEQGGVLGGPMSVESHALPLDGHGIPHEGDYGSAVVDDGFIQGGGHPSGPIHAKPIFPQGDAPLHLPPGEQAPLMAPVPQGQAPATGGQSVSTSPGADQQTQQSAKKKPGALRLGANLMMRATNVLQVGERALFAVDIDNTGETPIDTTKLEVVLSDNLTPASVNRREGASFSELKLQSAPNARIEGQKVTFDEIRTLGPDLKIQFQILADVKKGADSGSLEVTATSSALGGTPVKKSVPVTINP